MSAESGEMHFSLSCVRECLNSFSGQLSRGHNNYQKLPGKLHGVGGGSPGGKAHRIAHVNVRAGKSSVIDRAHGAKLTDCRRGCNPNKNRNP